MYSVLDQKLISKVGSGSDHKGPDPQPCFYAIELIPRNLSFLLGMYSVLDQKLFDTYIELKCEPVIAIIEPNMYMGKFDWAKCVRPTGARQGFSSVVKYQFLVGSGS